MISISKLAILASATQEPVSKDHELKSAQLSSPVGETLTAREIEILALISQGFTNKNIARTLKISPETVKSHIKRIFLKLAVSTRAAAVSRTALMGAYDSRKPSEEESSRMAVGARSSSSRNLELPNRQDTFDLSR